MGWVLALGRLCRLCSKLRFAVLFSTADFNSISEISPASERGMLMSGYQTVLQFCALLGFWGAFASHAVFAESSPFQWEIPVSIQLFPGIFLLLGTMVVPETPRFLAERGRFKAAERSLAMLRSLPMGDAELSREMDEICEAANVSKALLRNQRSFFKEVSTGGVRQRLVVGVGLMVAQNMVGLNALNYCQPIQASLKFQRC
jgi:MFS family permease